MTVSFDSNILISAFAEGEDCHRQASVIIERLAEQRAMLFDQVLREFLAVAHRKQFVTPVRARETAGLLLHAFTLATSDRLDLTAASDLAEQHKLQYNDALLCCTAKRTGCTFLLSRDMQDGFMMGTMRIVDPFASANASLLADLLA